MIVMEEWNCIFLKNSSLKLVRKASCQFLFFQSSILVELEQLLEGFDQVLISLISFKCLHLYRKRVILTHRVVVVVNQNHLLVDS